MSSDPEEISIKCRDMSLGALRYGPKDGIPVLAIHGWLDNAASFHRLAPLLPKHWQIIAIDLPGHGASDHRGAGSTYPYTEWVSDLFGCLQSLNWDKPILLGHSMGAGIASLFAGTFPERYRCLISIDGLIPLPEKPDQAPARLRSYVEASQRRMHRSSRSYKSIEDARAVRAKAGEFEDLGALTPVVERNLTQTTDGYVWRSDPRLRRHSALRMTPEQVLHFLSLVHKPALMVRASRGFPLTHDVLSTAQGAMPQLTIKEIEGFHHVHLDHPEQVAAAIRDWAIEHAVDL